MLGPSGKPTLMISMGTFAISAFWHGFYPFYYVMFFECALFVELSKEVYRCRILFDFIPDNFLGFINLRHVLGNVSTMITLNYFGTSFNSLTFERGFTFGRMLHHFVFLGVPMVLFLFKALGLAKMAKKKELAL
jgi:lysophospholipid acyltransferase